ncbi:MAG: CAP domain-containing protein, partial [Pseudonocardiaceae bacterium]
MTRFALYLAALSVALLPGASLLAGVTPAAADAACDEALMVAGVNDLRASRGLPTLIVDARLTDMARTWSGLMATTGVLSHNPALTTLAPVLWKTLAENVGVGQSATVVQNALVASTTHLTNMVDSRFNAIGVGIVVSGGNLWATQVFMQAPA